jgi:hypothetical protein
VCGDDDGAKFDTIEVAGAFLRLSVDSQDVKIVSHGTQRMSKHEPGGPASKQIHKS